MWLITVVMVRSPCCRGSSSFESTHHYNPSRSRHPHLFRDNSSKRPKNTIENHFQQTKNSLPFGRIILKQKKTHIPSCHHFSSDWSEVPIFFGALKNGWIPFSPSRPVAYGLWGALRRAAVEQLPAAETAVTWMARWEEFNVGDGSYGGEDLRTFFQPFPLFWWDFREDWGRYWVLWRFFWRFSFATT